MDILASFIGHDPRVHREFYHLSDEALQLARASKLFTLMDRGELARDQGKTLAQIDVSPDEIVECGEGSDEEEEEERMEKKATPKKKRKAQNDSGESDPEGFYISPKKKKKRRQEE